MKYNKSLACLLTFVSILQCSIYAQTVRFKIFKGSKQIGHISAIKESNSGKTTYKVTSKASSRIITKYVRETDMKVIYSDGGLESSDLKQTMNQNLKDHRITTRQGGQYNCIKGLRKEKFCLKESLDFCSSMLYFEEPKGRKQIFCESYQKLCPIKLIKAGTYELTLPQGKVNHYVYESGVLKEIRVFRTVTNLVFRRES